MRHELKILPQYFQAVWDDKKRFEVRKNDRDYKVGDVLVLKEWDGKKYTGSAIIVNVTYIYDGAIGGLEDGYVVMSIEHYRGEVQEKAADAIEALTAELRNCRDELCLRCGNYKEAHKGACDGCRYKEV